MFLVTRLCFFGSIDIYFDPLNLSFVYTPLLLCFDKPYHVQTHLSLGKANDFSIFAFERWWRRKIIALVRSVAFWWFHLKNKEKDNQVCEKVNSATLPSFLFILIEINRRMMIDSRYRRQSTIVQRNKSTYDYLLLVDYAFTVIYCVEHSSV